MEESQSSKLQAVFQYAVLGVGIYLCLTSLSFLLHGQAIIDNTDLCSWGVSETTPQAYPMKINEGVAFEGKVKAVSILVVIYISACIGLIPGILFVWRQKIPAVLEGLLRSNLANKSWGNLCGCGLLLLLFCWLIAKLQFFGLMLSEMIPFFYGNSEDYVGAGKIWGLLVSGIGISVVMLALILWAMIYVGRQVCSDDPGVADTE